MITAKSARAANVVATRSGSSSTRCAALESTTGASRGTDRLTLGGVTGFGFAAMRARVARRAAGA